jgi:hypothetical protein
MHNQILGNSKDHAASYLSISANGSILEGKVEKNKNWRILRKRTVFHLLDPCNEIDFVLNSSSQASSHYHAGIASQLGSASKSNIASQSSAVPQSNFPSQLSPASQTSLVPQSSSAS